jgi:glucokinase
VKAAVYVNGVPASGKSTVARAISAATGWPLLALDTIKEALFEDIGPGDREHNRMLGRASYRAIFALIAEFPADAHVVIDAWFGFQPRVVLNAHIARSGLQRIAEIWCHAPAEIIGARYAERAAGRSVGHLGVDYVPELIDLARRAAPLGVFPLLEVDTTQPAPDLAQWLRSALAQDPRQ